MSHHTRARAEGKTDKPHVISTIVDYSGGRKTIKEKQKKLQVYMHIYGDEHPRIQTNTHNTLSLKENEEDEEGKKRKRETAPALMQPENSLTQILELKITTAYQKKLLLYKSKATPSSNIITFVKEVKITKKNESKKNK